MLSSDRGGSRQKPCFVFRLRQHDPDVSVPSGFVGTPQQIRRQLPRAVGFRIEQDEDAPARSCLSGGQIDGSLQLSRLQHPLTLDSDGSRDL